MCIFTVVVFFCCLLFQFHILIIYLPKGPGKQKIRIYGEENRGKILLPACASEQGNVIGLVSVYIYVCTKKIII